MYVCLCVCIEKKKKYARDLFVDWHGNRVIRKDFVYLDDPGL